MPDPSDPVQDDTTTDGGESRRPLLIAAAVGAVLLVAALVLLVVTRDDGDGTTDTTSTTEVTDDAESATTSTPANTETEDPDPGEEPAAPEEEPVATSVPLGAVDGTTEAEICTAIVARLELYRAVVVDGLPDEELITALEEFEAQIDVQSDDQDWGDSIMESLTNVRREWATARAAAAADDAAEARARTDASIEHLDEAIDTTCPTP
jgi:hypothetical protein